MRKRILSLVFILVAAAWLFALPAVSGSVQSVNAESSADGKTVALPIVMYHRVAKAERGKYTVTCAELESDFAAILAAGYTPVFMREVIDWVAGRGALPERPVVITFDDGYYNNLCFALPIARRHNMKFMVSPVTGYSEYNISTGDTDNASYSHLTWAQIKELQDSGLCEIGNHTHKMHSIKPRYGIAKKRGEEPTQYETALRSDIDSAQKLIEQSGVTRPNVFVYPFGKYSTEGREILETMGFQSFLTCNEHVNKITQGDPACLRQLGRYNRAGGMSTERLLEKLAETPKRYL